MKILAIDPGTDKSASVEIWHGKLVGWGHIDNREMLLHIKAFSHRVPRGERAMAVEMIASYGMPVGREVFDTCVWIGRFVEAWNGPHKLVYRRDVKLHLCKTVKAKDSNVRAALLDRFGPGKPKAIGSKLHPGPLYGVHGDVWAALAVGITYTDAIGGKEAIPRLTRHWRPRVQSDSPVRK